MRHYFWHTCGQGSDGLDREVFVFTAALGAALETGGWVCFVLECTDGALSPSKEFTGFASSSPDLVADPSEEDSSKKDEEGRENQPWQGHANHGSAGWGGFAAK
jgi:hypothetical protein